LKPKVAIVILNWNGRKHLQQFLPFVQATTYANFEVIMADNASTDDSVTYTKQHHPSVNIIELPQNYGFAKGYNKALQHVQADYYVLLNSDVEVTPNWLQPVIDLMETDKTIGACQPKILMHGSKNLFEYAGAAGGWLDYLGYPFARGRVFDFCEEDKGQYNDNQQTFWASGAAMFVRSNVYNLVNGLDEFFFAHQEEIDMCWRMQLAGYKVMVCPASVVYHVGGGTLPKGNEKKVYLNFRNNLIMLAKNLTTGKAVFIISYRFLLDTISACKSLFGGEAVYFKAIAKAHLSFIAWLFSAKKNNIFPPKKTIAVYGIYHKSIVWQHFVKGKKRFSEIVNTKK
jgi:GT2 family glycosyltransferase